MVKAVENLRKRKATGGRRRPFRSRRAYEADDYAIETEVGDKARSRNKVANRTRDDNFAGMGLSGYSRSDVESYPGEC